MYCPMGLEVFKRSRISSIELISNSNVESFVEEDNWRIHLMIDIIICRLTDLTSTYILISNFLFLIVRVLVMYF